MIRAHLLLLELGIREKGLNLVRNFIGSGASPSNIRKRADGWHFPRLDKVEMVDYRSLVSAQPHGWEKIADLYIETTDVKVRIMGCLVISPIIAKNSIN